MENSYYDFARDAWNNAAEFRARRLRFKRYTFGDQWGDRAGDSFRMTERQRMDESKYNPVTDNVIRRLVKTAVGYCRTMRKREPLAADDRRPMLPDIDARTFEEFLVSGCAVQQVVRQCRGGVMDTWIDPISPSRFFIGPFSGYNGDDVELIGCLHDMTLSRVMMTFGHGDPARAGAIRRIYEEGERDNLIPRARRLGESFNDCIDFSRADDGLCRVVEVWTFDVAERLRCHDPETGRFNYSDPRLRKAIERGNFDRLRAGRRKVESRWEMTGQWTCRFYAPGGHLLHSCTAQSHPFVFLLYPFIDGEIHPFVEDLLENQRNVNRLLALNDRILASSAKGVLLFPDSQISPSMDIEEVARQWASPDGVVLYSPEGGVAGPQQVFANRGDFGIDRLIERQTRVMGETSGITDAMRGDVSSGINSTRLYDMRLESSMAAMSDIFEPFNAFLRRRDTMLCGG